ncbi:unnamed protein product [Trichogramma brassicae]|uniref:Uncharacterized protein n=1 Tax=Trichogramma brassicae TaxID=86971 RepID=A0A6H5IF67_9HYME|nr:unnamed protein product [Trichogramma brassicae]
MAYTSSLVLATTIFPTFSTISPRLRVQVFYFKFFLRWLMDTRLSRFQKNKSTTFAAAMGEKNRKLEKVNLNSCPSIPSGMKLEGERSSLAGRASAMGSSRPPASRSKWAATSHPRGCIDSYFGQSTRVVKITNVTSAKRNLDRNRICLDTKKKFTKVGKITHATILFQCQLQNFKFLPSCRTFHQCVLTNSGRRCATAERCLCSTGCRCTTLYERRSARWNISGRIVIKPLRIGRMSRERERERKRQVYTYNQRSCDTRSRKPANRRRRIADGHTRGWGQSSSALSFSLTCFKEEDDSSLAKNVLRGRGRFNVVLACDARRGYGTDSGQADMWSSVTAAGVENGPAPPSRSKHSALCWPAMFICSAGAMAICRSKISGATVSLPLILKRCEKFGLIKKTCDGQYHMVDAWVKMEDAPRPSCCDCENCHGGCGYCPKRRGRGAESRWEELRPTGEKPPALQEHSTVAYKDCLYVFGGELGFSAGTETPLWCYSIKHSAVLHGDFMYIYGGMTDLQERSDCWRWDAKAASWCLLRAKTGPGPLHGHAACRLPSCMLIFGGESGGSATNELWRFHFASDSRHRDLGAIDVSRTQASTSSRERRAHDFRTADKQQRDQQQQQHQQLRHEQRLLSAPHEEQSAQRQLQVLRLRALEFARSSATSASELSARDIQTFADQFVALEPSQQVQLLGAERTG